MDVSPKVQFIELVKAVPGELVRFELRSASALAVVMRQTDRGTVCAFLETNDEARAPFYMLMTIEGIVCMSYGLDWALDLKFGVNVFPGNNTEVPGAILLADNVVAMHLNRPPDDIRATSGTFDLRTFKAVSPHRRVGAWGDFLADLALRSSKERTGRSTSFWFLGHIAAMMVSGAY